MRIVLGLYNRWHQNAVRFHSSRNWSEIKAGHRSNSSPLVERLWVGGRDGRAWKANPWSKALWTWHASWSSYGPMRPSRMWMQTTVFPVSHLAIECKLSLM